MGRQATDEGFDPSRSDGLLTPQHFTQDQTVLPLEVTLQSLIVVIYQADESKGSVTPYSCMAPSTNASRSSKDSSDLISS